MDGYTKQIQDILKKASNEKRALTLEEQQKINEIQGKMKTNAVKSLSDTEVESKVILERLKGYSNRITSEQASEVIKNAENQRKQAVDKANKQYDETVRTIIKMRDESKSITKDQADKMIAEAERQKKGSISKAGEMKDGVVEKVKSMNSDIIKDIDESDGHIKTRWEKLKDWFANNPIIRWIRTQTSGDSGGDAGQNWTGTTNWRGGLTYLHERGWELYDLPKGARVYNHQASEEMVMRTAESVAEKVASRMLGNVQGNSGVNVTQNIYSPTPRPSEVARQTKNSLRELGYW